jgi:phosphate uptake regulator
VAFKIVVATRQDIREMHGDLKGSIATMHQDVKSMHSDLMASINLMHGDFRNELIKGDV